MPDLLAERLNRQVLIFDGAMGTEIYKRHFFVNTSFEGLCLTHPQVIRDIHAQYVAAGAEVLTTNSYAAHFTQLSGFGLGDKVREINAAAVRLARDAAGGEVLVAGSVGPIGKPPLGLDITEDRIVEQLAEQAAALAEAGADFLLFETLASRRDVARAVRAAAGLTLPYALSFKVDREGETPTGAPLAVLLDAARAAPRGPSAIGLNCGEGPESTLAALEKLMPQSPWPVIVQPNAGVPKNVDGRMIYMTSPEYLTTYAVRYLQLGARGIGGCCGTGPEHIRDMARSIRPLSAAHRTARLATIEARAPLREPVPAAERSRFAGRLLAGAWVTSVEITPPRGTDLGPVVERARQCRDAGVDAINIPDGPRASARLSPLVTAWTIQQQAGIETVLHFCCRDKSLIGMQAELLGCAAVGIRNLLFITGDPPKLGDFPFSSAVFDADSIGMARIQDRMNRGVDLGGQKLDPPTRAFIGVGADPNAVDAARELRRLREKVEAGADFIITQPVFAVEPLVKFLASIADLRRPVLAGVWPLASYRNAEFMKNEVPGVVVPDEIMRRMAGADTREAQREEGIAIARETVARLRGAVQGIQVSAPFGNVGTALAVLRA